MIDKQWVSAPYLDALRPDFGWHVEYALLASYSADLYAVVAAMLALAGVDDDRGSGSKVDFANALERLHGKFRLLIQSGRLVAPRKAPKILGLLDQFIREAPFDEKVQSWHPKISLVKTRKDQSDEDDGIQWRLWIGSRNLTRDLSWDAGMTLVGTPDGEGQTIDGVIELASTLAARSNLDQVTTQSIADDLKNIRWQCPMDCDVQEVRLYDQRVNRSLPASPTGLTRLLVVSPFLDGKTIRTLSTWGSNTTSRTLLSSKTKLLELAHQKSKPLSGFSTLLAMAAPDSDELSAAGENIGAESDSEDEEPEPRGLHAKLILAEHSTGVTLWIGSANATGRGWDGPNAEVIVKCEVSTEVAEGLWEFAAGQLVIQPEELVDPPEVDKEMEQLEEARAQVSSRWNVTQRVADDSPILTATAAIHPDNPNALLEVASLSGKWVAWTRGLLELKLPAIQSSDVTELVACRLLLGESETSWLQRAPLDPPPDVDRDHLALSRFLDARTFLQWLRSLLVGTVPGDGGGDWNESGSTRKKASNVGPAWWSPTLEEVLKAWSRDPSSLKEVDRKAQVYMTLYQQRDPSEVSDDERKVIEAFSHTWQIVRLELVKTR